MSTRGCGRPTRCQYEQTRPKTCSHAWLLREMRLCRGSRGSPTRHPPTHGTKYGPASSVKQKWKTDNRNGGGAACTRTYRTVHRVWCILQDIVVCIGSSVNDFLNFAANCNHSIAKAINFCQVLALGRLDHQRSRDGPGHGWGMEAVVNQSLCDVLLANATLLQRQRHKPRQ